MSTNGGAPGPLATGSVVVMPTEGTEIAAGKMGWFEDVDVPAARAPGPGR